jgi:hypothetical protein
MEYTKGKWEPIFKHYKKEPKRICTGVGINYNVKGRGTYTVFICNSLLPETDEEYIDEQVEIEANMKLIAAAPDLLKACIDIRQVITDVISQMPKPITGSIIEVLDNAIKKAKE